MDKEPEKVRRFTIKFGRDGGFMLGARTVTFAVKFLRRSNIISHVKAGDGR